MTTEARLLVFDPKGKWAELDRCRAIHSRRELYEIAQAGLRGRFAFVSANVADFNFWARAAYWWGYISKLHGQRSVVVAEELSAFTHPGKAPPGWHLLVTQGLEFEIDIWSLMQRPAESDKTCLGNATRLRVFALTRFQDCRYIANELDCDPAEISRLPPLHYVERDMLTGKLSRGQVRTNLRKAG